MKKRFLFMTVSSILSISILFSSCIGTNALFNKLHGWNSSLGDKWLNELVYLAFWIIPVYEITWLADNIVLNSIEFWTGDNPVAMGTTKNLKLQNGNDVTIKTERYGYRIENKTTKDVVVFKYDKSKKTWNIETKRNTYALFKFIDNKNVAMYLPNGNTMKVGLDKAGVTAFRQVVENKAYLAYK